MRVLVVTNMYPTPRAPFYGIFVAREVDALRGLGVDIDVFFVDGRRTRLEYARLVPGVWRRVRTGRYDIVHVHHAYCAFAATLQHRVPVVWTFHEGEILNRGRMGPPARWTRRLAYSPRFKRAMARRVDVVVTVAAALAGPLGRPDAITIPAGVDLERFRPMDRSEACERLGLDADRPRVLFPASPDRPEKRFALARAAVDRLVARCPDLGDVDLVGLRDVPWDDVPVWMNASDVVLMTSAFEASPVTVREALACEVPVVSTDVGDVRLVVEGLPGCGVAPDDPDALAGRLEAAFGLGGRVPGARERMRAWSLETSARRVLEVYARLAGGRAREDDPMR